MVRDAPLLAKLLDDRLRAAHVQPGHAREEVMLDLVVERAIPEIGERMTPDVARGQHLRAHEVEARVEVTEPTGPDTLAVLELGGLEVTARLRPDTKLKPGDHVVMSGSSCVRTKSRRESLSVWGMPL